MNNNNNNNTHLLTPSTPVRNSYKRKKGSSSLVPKMPKVPTTALYDLLYGKNNHSNKLFPVNKHGRSMSFDVIIEPTSYDTPHSPMSEITGIGDSCIGYSPIRTTTGSSRQQQEIQQQNDSNNINHKNLLINDTKQLPSVLINDKDIQVITESQQLVLPNLTEQNQEITGRSIRNNNVCPYFMKGIRDDWEQQLRPYYEMIGNVSYFKCTDIVV